MRIRLGIGVLLLASACSSSTSGGGGSGGTGAGGSGGHGGTGGTQSPSDFPAAPIVDPSAPAGAAALFGSPDADLPGGPCLVDPQRGSMFPSNWIRPRFRWIAPVGQNLFELRLHAAEQANDLVVVTAQTSWTMPAEMWRGLASSSAGFDFTLRALGQSDGAKNSGPFAGTAGSMDIAPAEAPGSIVFYSTTGLKSFAIGEETVHDLLSPGQVQMTTFGNQATCIGCHAVAPDGNLAFDTSDFAIALAKGDGSTPEYVTGGGLSALQSSHLYMPTFSAAHFSESDRIMVAVSGEGSAAVLNVYELGGGLLATLGRVGDSHGAGAPAFSHDGKTVAYVSSDAGHQGTLTTGAADIYTIPYGSRTGGNAMPVLGASDPNINEYYPAFSPDDAFLAFDQGPGGDNMYNQQKAEISVVPADGGDVYRLPANDPPACTGAMSPGVTNSWPRFAPGAPQNGSATYYFLVFSSTRAAGNAQIEVTPLVLDGGRLRGYPALYPWNQDPTADNHTPFWRP